MSAEIPVIHPRDSGESPAPTSAISPDRIGRFKIERVLGSGGFATVYLGYDEDLQRRVAIKVLLQHRVTDAEACMDEARILARLDHPHIVPVFDLGRTEDSLFFVVSKFIEGTDLRHRLQQNRFSPPEAAELVATVAEALHHAHTRELVHRDIKPENILIDGLGKPYVADFGIALRDEDFGKGSDNELVGTPTYMSPEQARGEGHLVDGRSDIFSLGIVFYELLTGINPFRGANWAGSVFKVLSVEAKPPRQIIDTIPKELERICLKALSKRVGDRYTTAKDFADDLRDCLSEMSAALEPAPQLSSDNLVHQLWRYLEPDLQDSLALAYNQARREGKNRISTRTFFAAVARLKPKSVSNLLSLLPEGSMPEPIAEDVPVERRIMQETPLLSDCVENALRHLGTQDNLKRGLGVEDVFVDVAKYGRGPSVQRLRAHGVSPERIDRYLDQLGLEVASR